MINPYAISYQVGNVSYLVAGSPALDIGSFFPPEQLAINFPDGVLVPMLGHELGARIYSFTAGKNLSLAAPSYSGSTGGGHGTVIISSDLARSIPGANRAATATEEERKLFVLLNFLMRPPLTTHEIASMPVDEVIQLYYSLNTIKDCAFLPNKVTSAGLPYDYAVANDRKLQDRIYKTRQDLWQVQNPSDGKWYRVLLPAGLLQPPNASYCKSGLGQTVVLGALGLAGGWVAVAAAVASAALSTQKAMDTKALVERANDIGREVGTGIDVAHAMMTATPVEPATLLQLRTMSQQWWDTIAKVKPVAHQILSLWPKMPLPEVLLAIGGRGSVPGGQGYHDSQKQDAANYVANWKPYEPFFYSDTVSKLVTGQSVSSKATPDLAGIGIGALLLLLL